MKNKFSEKDLLIIGSHAKKASRFLSQINSKLKNDMLCSAAEILSKKKDLILKANEKDIEENKEKLNSATLDRLILSEKRVDAISNGLVEISRLDDPVGKIIDRWSRPNGLKIDKISIPT